MPDACKFLYKCSSSDPAVISVSTDKPSGLLPSSKLLPSDKKCRAAERIDKKVGKIVSDMPDSEALPDDIKAKLQDVFSDYQNLFGTAVDDLFQTLQDQEAFKWDKKVHSSSSPQISQQQPTPQRRPLPMSLIQQQTAPAVFHCGSPVIRQHPPPFDTQLDDSGRQSGCTIRTDRATSARTPSAMKCASFRPMSSQPGSRVVVQNASISATVLMSTSSSSVSSGSTGAILKDQLKTVSSMEHISSSELVDALETKEEKQISTSTGYFSQLSQNTVHASTNKQLINQKTSSKEFSPPTSRAALIQEKELPQQKLWENRKVLYDIAEKQHIKSEGQTLQAKYNRRASNPESVTTVTSRVNKKTIKPSGITQQHRSLKSNAPGLENLLSVNPSVFLGSQKEKSELPVQTKQNAIKLERLLPQEHLKGKAVEMSSSSPEILRKQPCVGSSEMSNKQDNVMSQTVTSTGKQSHELSTKDMQRKGKKKSLIETLKQELKLVTLADDSDWDMESESN
ncbi:uncharacterized protein LOC122791460 [Protopterus annectens]|uniref:uncharacterized protein LOC122791460 n=1 Tax=Protopterus annectens TaxID=7888 RepID=UPI001CF978BC|nr:uncharacterized protein LOC122791460 [Protopterus annectens]